MDYFLVKQLHMSAATLSIILFITRAIWSVTENGLLHKRVVKILPHIIDTVLLVCGVILAIMIGPEQPWILTKIVLLIVYIGVGTIAIKRGKTRGTRATAALIAVAVFAYIVGVAINHDSLSWFA
ncbi:SirB2 family protein [Alcaligenaceae bacterium CGII-47]|nr:SirB2 family protein [Alcaligenaceae bacterium CGII-47]